MNDARAGEIVLTAPPDCPGAPTPIEGPEPRVETTLETVSPASSASDLADPAVSAPRQTTPFHRRLPRFARAKHSYRPPLALQGRDLDLLRTVNEYRLITTPQFLQLFRGESTDGIYRRLQKLFHHGYLERIGTNPNAPLVYALARRGAAVLGVSERKQVSDPYTAHQLMIGNFRIALTLATQAREIGLAWRSIPRNLPIKPDGFFVLQFPNRPDGRNRAFFFLEADRSTMTRERYVEKLLRYEEWWARGDHTEALGIRSFRVLTVTKSPERLSGLIAVAAGEPRLSPWRRYWFACETNTLGSEGGRVFEPIWQLPGISGPPASLLPRQEP